MCRDSGSVTGKSQSFFCRCLHTHLILFQAEDPRDPTSHTRDVKLQFRSLTEHGTVNVSNRITSFPEDPGCFRQKHGTVRTEITVIRIRKMLSDISRRGGSQHCIHNGVQQHIRI